MAKTSKAVAEPRRQAYITLNAIESDTPNGAIRFLPGSIIWMTDDQAIIYLAKGGLIEPAEGTIPPTPPKPPITIVNAGQSAEWDSGDLVVVTEDSE